MKLLNIVCHILCLGVGLQAVVGQEGGAPIDLPPPPPPPPIPPPPFAEAKPTEEPNIPIDPPSSSNASTTILPGAEESVSETLSTNASDVASNVSSDVSEKPKTDVSTNASESVLETPKDTPVTNVTDDPLSKPPPPIEPIVPDVANQTSNDTSVPPKVSAETNVTAQEVPQEQVDMGDGIKTDANVSVTPAEGTPSETTDNTKGLPSPDMKGIKVDLPPPPPIFDGKKPKVIVKTDPTATTIEIKTIPFDILGNQTAESEVTVTAAITPATTSQTTAGLVSAVTDQTVTEIPLENRTEELLVTSTIDPFFEATLKPDKPPTKTVGVQALGDRVRGLPPPIFVSDSRPVREEKPGKPLIDKPTDKQIGGKGTAQPPPPPILFPEVKESPTSWIDPRLTTRAPVIVMPEKKQIKHIPPELDPKFMSVSDLAFYTLKQMEKERKIKESSGKGMGVQTFFNTLQPFEHTTPGPVRPQQFFNATKPQGQYNPSFTTEKSESIFGYYQTTPSYETAKPLKPPPSSKTFYTADDLLSQIGIMPGTPQGASDTKSNQLFKPFQPVITDARPGPNQWPNKIDDTSTKSKIPTDQGRPFFNSKYLLNQIGAFTTPGPPTQQLGQSERNWQNQGLPSRGTETRPFYNSDFLMKQLGIVTTPSTTTATFKPVQRKQFVNIGANKVIPTRNNAAKHFISPNSRTHPSRNQPFFDSKYLLKQFGLLTTSTPAITTRTLVVTTRKPIVTERKPKPKTVFKPFFLGMNFADSPQRNTWPQDVKPNAFSKFKTIEKQVVKFQRRGQVHTRPIDLRTNTNTQPILDYNVSPGLPQSLPDRGFGVAKRIDNTNTQPDGVTDRQPLATQVQPQPNMIDEQQSRGVRYIYGNAPVDKHTTLWQQTHLQGNSIAERLRNKFNSRLKQNQESENFMEWPRPTLRPPPAPAVNTRRDLQITSDVFDIVKPSRDSMFNFNTNFQGRVGGQGAPNVQPKLSNQFSYGIPRTGSEVRRDFNQHIKNEFKGTTVSSISSWNQPSFPYSKNQPQFPLAAKRGIETQVSPLRTSALLTDFFKPSNYKTTIKTLEDFSKAKAERSKPDPPYGGFQTHWGVPELNRSASNVINVPYKINIERKGSGTDVVGRVTTMSPFIERALTTAKPVVVTRMQPTTTMAQTTTTMVPTTTTQSTTYVTTTTTVPPTADPNPPPIFDTKILQTFMPFPKPGDTTNPTIKGDQQGWGDNNTDSNIDGRCSRCVFVNDRCLLPDPKHCNIYIECVRQGRQVRAFVRACALGAFFDRNSFLCVDPKIADCPTDRCREPGVKWYPIEGHCKHYWSCGIREGGSAFAQSECCPDMGGFEDGVGCVENPNCTESCESAINQNVPTGCKLRQTASPTIYYDENAKMERPCAPGTLFNELQCTCIQDVTFERSENRTGGQSCNCTNDTTCACRGATQAPTGETYCASSMTLTFDGKTITDNSNMKQHIGVEGVSQTKTGEGIFNGGGKLVLWRYANLMIPIVFAVRLKFLPTSTEPRFQTLLSNCDTNGAIEPTFELSIDTLYSEVVFNINTYEGPAKRFKIMYEPTGWSSVDLIYDGERIVGSVNGRSRNIISGGGIETRPFPLAVGGCSVKTGFKGLMDNLYIYEECIPDDMYGIFMSVLE